jgi:hypothetical protein
VTCGGYDAAVRRWPEVRAGLVTLAIAVGLADGCPLPVSTQAPPALREPVRAVKQVRHAALTPFRPLGELLRLRQRWKLFPTAKREQVRMWIETRDAASGEWSLLYRPGDAGHDRMADRLEYRRLRAAWNPGSRGARASYAPLVEWLAGELFAADPAIDRVRVRMEEIVLEPEEGRFTALHDFMHTKVKKR